MADRSADVQLASDLVFPTSDIAVKDTLENSSGLRERLSISAVTRPSGVKSDNRKERSSPDSSLQDAKPITGSRPSSDQGAPMHETFTFRFNNVTTRAPVKDELYTRYDTLWKVPTERKNNFTDLTALVASLAARSCANGLPYTSELNMPANIEAIKKIANEVIAGDSYQSVDFKGDNLVGYIERGLIPHVVLLTTALLVRYETEKFPIATFKKIFTEFGNRTAMSLYKLSDPSMSIEIDNDDIREWHKVVIQSPVFRNTMCRKCMTLIFDTYMCSKWKFNELKLPNLTDVMFEILQLIETRTNDFVTYRLEQKMQVWKTAFEKKSKLEQIEF
jgi:hypothetical protein